LVAVVLQSVKTGAQARQKDGKRRLVRQAVFFCLDFSLLLSFDQAKESKSKLFNTLSIM
jgi:hypothetical protein